MSKAEVTDLFGSKLLGRTVELQAERDKLLRYLAGANLLIVGLAYVSHAYVPLAAFVYAGAVIGFSVALNKFFFGSFARRFKSDVVADVFEALMPGCDYDPQDAVSETQFRQSLFKDQFDEFTGEDRVRGKIGKISVDFSEMKAVRITKNKKGRDKKVVVYEGLFFDFKLPSSLKQNTLILQDRAENLLGRNLGRFLQKKTAITGYQLVQLESLEFEKKFAVYSTDQIRARVLLSPATMEKLYKFLGKFGHKVELSFQQDHIYVCLRLDRNLFEPKVTGKIFSMADIREIYNIVHFIENFYQHIDILSDVA